MYDRRIEVYEKSTERDDYNEREDSLQLVGIYWAQKTENGGRENLYAHRIVHENEVVFTIRYASRVKAGMIVKFEGSEMEIISVHEEGRKQNLHIKCMKYDVKD